MRRCVPLALFFWYFVSLGHGYQPSFFGQPVGPPVLDTPALATMGPYLDENVCGVFAARYQAQGYVIDTELGCYETLG